MNDKNCSICKTELEEIVISKDMESNWENVDLEDCIQDKEDKTIYYEDAKAKGAGMQLRSLQCLMYNCPSTQNFPN